MTGGDTTTGCANTQAAPTLLLSAGPPTIAVRPSEESATPVPSRASLVATPDPTNSAPCWVQTPLMRVNTQVAPMACCLPKVVINPPGPPAMAVLPSAESATD